VLAYDPFGVAGVGGGEDVGAGGLDSIRLSMIDALWRVPGDAGMPVFGVRCSVFVPAEEALAERAGVLDAAEPVREVGPYFRVLNWASLYGLSYDVCGLEWVLVTPRSASRNTTGLDAIEEPLSAWMVSVSRSMRCLTIVSASNFSASRADSRSAISQPTT
jgi:hypothetical protein